MSFAAGTEVAVVIQPRKGWIAIPLGEGDDVDSRPPAAILFDNTAYGFVSEEDRARHAWVLE